MYVCMSLQRVFNGYKMEKKSSGIEVTGDCEATDISFGS